MRTINKIKGKMEVGAKMKDSCPCWYAKLEYSQDRNEASWNVGVNDENNTSWSFKISNVGDVSVESFWKWSTSVNFACAMIDKLKLGLDELQAWVKDGCPSKS